MRILRIIIHTLIFCPFIFTFLLTVCEKITLFLLYHKIIFCQGKISLYTNLFFLLYLYAMSSWNVPFHIRKLFEVVLL